jgi:hypothetical protein
MAVNLDVMLQGAIFDVWAVPVTFLPIASQPAAPSYDKRGILNTYSIDVAAENGSLYSEQRTILDIRDSEFGTLPVQNDHCIIPKDCNNVPKGEYQILTAASDGGGQTMLTIRKVMPPTVTPSP